MSSRETFASSSSSPSSSSPSRPRACSPSPTRGSFTSDALTRRRSLVSGRIIDVWSQPAYMSLLNGLPEGQPLLVKSGSAQAGATTGLTLKQHLALMDRAGMGKVLMSAWYRQSGVPLIPNENIYDLIKSAPTRIGGLCSVKLDDPVLAVKQIETSVREHGCVGVRVVPWLWNLPPNHKFYYPIYVKCIELDIPFCTQVGHTGPMCPSDTGRPIPYLDEVALQFPKLKIVGGHIGHPWTDEIIGMAWKYDNVYIDTSAYIPRAYPPALIEFMKTKIGQNKVLFGVNFPQLDWRKCVDQALELPIDDSVLEKFMYRNAARVFQLDIPHAPITSAL